jgi:hypothetical protein
VSSDRRWTGGLANREWQRGTQAAAVPLDIEQLRAQVRRYLADCKRAGLASAYHPTAAGACKVIYHQGTAQRLQIIRAFERESSGALLRG